ncbi:DUF445 domain-containing protein [Nocardioides mangrovicus]|uniref:DUF445 domain-containing protein n=2 Tax=Nocardioides mangrovicus TaxID=2478913 RepID=A0A3L8P8C3_9ACTN|nr:DUF445 domain-containing protein [Nocardioides mangrovicus]
MRTVATSLLALAAVVYVATLHLAHSVGGFWGYVNAGAEASMVGAIADWFAVTALFRHPLGVPVPHTALVPRRKDELGRGLESFVRENFLAEPVVRERLASAELARRTGEWLRQPANAARAVDEASALVSAALRRVRDEDVAVVVVDVLIPRLRQEPLGPVLGSLLGEVVEDGAHHGMVDLVLEEAHRWLAHHQDTFTDVIGQRAPWWAPPRLNEVVTDRLHLEAIRWVADVRGDPDHEVRHAIDSALTQLAQDLLDDPGTQARADRLRDRLLEQPQLVESGLRIWSALRQALVEALADAEGPLRRRAVTEAAAFGGRLATEPALQQRFDAWASDAAVFVVERYGAELTGVITQTIQRWDGTEASRRIELHVGRDLQFIRINGTLVGGLVGLVIHAASEVLS